MARYYDQNAGTKATAAATTVVFTATDIPGAGVVAYHFLFAGAGMTFGDLTRIRVKGAGQTLFDVDPTALQAWINRYYGSNLAPVAGDVSFTIPFWYPTQAQGDPQAGDFSQMPSGLAPTIELVIGAGGAVGTVQAAWTISDMKPTATPALLGSAMNIGVGPAVNQHYPLFEQGGVKGVCLNTTGLTRARLVMGGLQRMNIEGTTLFSEIQRFANTNLPADPVFVDLGGPQSAPAGNSYWELDVTGAWAGATNESTLYAIRGQ